MADPRISIVIITRDRCRDLLEALAHLRELPEAPRVIVVDNASQDGTADAVRRDFPAVEVLALDENRGPAARNLGVQRATTPYVAFNDDDSWWEPGALSAAADLLDAHPNLALVNGHILVGPDQRPDPVCLEMAESPLPLEPGQPGRALLSFIACGAIVRRDAFLAVGGFHERLGVGGEEEIVGHRLALAGWQQSYVAEIVTHHHPSAERDHHSRGATEVRNALWTAWLTRPLGGALAASARALRPDPASVRGAAAALAGLPWVWRERRPAGRRLEAQRRLLEQG
jgi:N-acetylglucosaminyl-diphospho-decaprenol L-rhamnosyltransferase